MLNRVTNAQTGRRPWLSEPRSPMLEGLVLLALLLVFALMLRPLLR
jgi:hypothetical protein